MDVDIKTSLKSLRLHGMATAWEELTEGGETSRVEGSKWLIEHLLEAEDTNREMLSLIHISEPTRPY